LISGLSILFDVGDQKPDETACFNVLLIRPPRLAHPPARLFEKKSPGITMQIRVFHPLKVTDHREMTLYIKKKIMLPKLSLILQFIFNQPQTGDIGLLSTLKINR
jgi:hypothetical protein